MTIEDTDDLVWMRRAIALAELRVGQTGSNPAVGCVIVREGQLLSEGVTSEGGRPHGEENALAPLEDGVRGATAYVTLEPCARRSTGTLSCSERLIRAGVARVVIACTDPSIHANGHGIAAMRAAGIVVELGMLAQDAGALYERYNALR